ncbi:MAG TPA: protein translocase subunit SecD [Gemmatimonadaceae bacterium]
MNLKYRILTIVALILGSVWALWPRTVVERVKRDGVFVYDTIYRVPLKRGLDLQGGMYLALEVDESKGAVANKEDALQRALKVVRNRVDEFGVAEPNVQTVGNDRIVVELPGIDDPERAEAVVQQAAHLQFMITDETNALERALPRLDQIAREVGGPQAGGALGDTARSSQVSGLQKLFTQDTAAKGTDTTTTDSATTPPPTGGPISSLLQRGDMPGEYYISSANVPRAEYYFSLPQIQQAIPPGKAIKWSADTLSLGGQVFRTIYVVDARPIITGEHINDARPNNTPIDGTVVEFQLDNEGGRKFRNETRKHVQDYMAIVLDDRVMGRPPVIQSEIGTRGQITLGRRDIQEAQDLALVLRAGALPVPLKIADVRSIGASLGDDAIRQGLSAGALGIAIVVLIMVVYYRFSGFLAVLGLMFYSLTTLAVLAGFGAVLTLPGIAGFVLSIGMAVDANFLIFERIREEIDRGKTIRTAIDEGFSHAWSAIVDTHVTTALTAAILYQFGTGPVQGFAVALLAGLAASMVSAIFVVRTLFLIWLNRTRGTTPLSI